MDKLIKKEKFICAEARITVCFILVSILKAFKKFFSQEVLTQLSVHLYFWPCAKEKDLNYTFLLDCKI